MIGIREMRISDLPTLMELKKSVGWNQTEWDWLQFLENRRYCLVATVSSQVVGTIAAYSYGIEVAWIGMVIVDKNFRGKGISKLLLEQMIKELIPHHQVIKLDATPAGEPVYKKLGFKEERTFNRMTGSQLNLQGEYNASLRPLNGVQEIAKMDLGVLGYPRQRLLKEMIQKYPDYGLCKVVDHQLEGYLLGRDGSNFVQFGPLISLSDKVAIELLHEVILKNKLRSVVVDINRDKIKLIQYLEHIGFSYERTFTRMFLGKPLDIQEEFQYLITGPEFG